MTSDPWHTAIGEQARRIHAETGSVEGTARELVRRGATDDEIRELFYPLLKAQERRLLDLAVQLARSDLWGEPDPLAIGGDTPSQTTAANAERAKVSAALADRARKMRSAGLTADEIAERLDRSPRRVRDYLREG
jgi:DNA-binding CsgD family transcriptional regulator